MRHLRIYRAIRLIHRSGSIRKAAERLAVSPSALNRALQAFEDEMRVTLFDRVPGGVRPTSAGELLLGIIERHLFEFDEVQRQLGTLRDGGSGTLRVSVGRDLGAGLVLSALAEVEADHPGVSVSVLAEDTAEALRRREVELSVLTIPQTDHGVEVLAAAEVPLAAWHRDAGDAPPTALWELAAQRLILPPETTGTRIAVSHLLRRHRLPEPVTTTLAADQLWPSMAAEGRACIFPTIVGPPQGSGAPPLRLSLALGTVQVSVLRAAGVPVTRPAQAFLNRLQQRLDAEAIMPARG